MNDVRVEAGAKVWVVGLAFVVLLGPAWALGGCGRALNDRTAEDGRLRVRQVVPAEGAVDAEASFRVEFSAQMDASLLLSDVDRSETVALVRAADAERALAALGRAHPTDRERELFVSARAELTRDLKSIALYPEAPLAVGDWALVVSGRLSDVAGRPLEDAARFLYTVSAQPPAPQLLSPVAGTEAPLNLMTVRVDFPLGAPGELVTLQGPDGPLGVALAPEDPGVAVISLCPSLPCQKLAAGETYRVFVGSDAITGASFEAASCSRADPVVVREVDVHARDTSAEVRIQLDGPSAVRLEVAEDESASPSGPDEQAFERLCAGGACREAEALVRCAPLACGASTDDDCQETVTLSALTPGKAFLLRVRGQDDEGRPVTFPLQRFSTTQEIPVVVLTEVMASPAGPEPKADGEYVEIWNPGPAAVDVASLVLAGPDGEGHALLGTVPPAPVILRPGQRALAVGASFDAARYDLPVALVLLRASTKRLLVYGLVDDPVASLVLAASLSGRPPIEVSRFPGGGPKCPAGTSLERTATEPAAWQCGKPGGSPGRAP